MEDKKVAVFGIYRERVAGRARVDALVQQGSFQIPTCRC